jgi:branched-chain amino acid transport system substrate-binding protein
MKKAYDDGFTPNTPEFMEATVAAMKATDLDCVTGHITFDERNNPVKQAIIIKITGGKEKYWGKF